MATRIFHLNAYRRVTTKATPGTDCGKVRTGTRKNAAARKTRNKTVAPVLQIPTAANKAQRCAAAVLENEESCYRALGHTIERLGTNKITGVLLVTATDLAGDDFNLQFGGVYSDDAEAALSSLECMVKHFKERAQKERNDRAMAAATPVKRPAFEVAL